VSAIPEKYQGLRSFAFGDGPALADELLDLVMKGVKTATCSTEDEPNTSAQGERWIVLDGSGRPACVIETTEVSYRRFGEVDAAFAFEEGEGDRSLACWRAAHRNYFGRLGKFSEDMMLMCERFRLVEVLNVSSARHALSVPSPLVGEETNGASDRQPSSQGHEFSLPTTGQTPSPACGARKRGRGQEKQSS
jgi:uncharacterized protein YhfF